MENTERSKREGHEQLARIVKGVHKHLRREFRANGDRFEDVWQQHSRDQTSLQLYADAMYRLATEHWSVHPETRIDWCRKVAVEYFLKDGLKLALEKDAKRKFHEALRAKEGNDTSDARQTDSLSVNVGDQIPSSCLTSSTSAGLGQQLSHTATSRLSGDDERTPSTGSTKTRGHKEHDAVVITLPLAGKIRLLDVGSCYNPFKNLEEFDVLGIDLRPAKESQSVLQCDFLALNTVTLQPPDDPLAFDLSQLNSPLQQLPRCSFHVVVFCLLLEYLPSPVQRWQCCVRAHSLLAMQGLLLVITPDSHSQHRNSPMMKSWKSALESLGFLRWKYEKKDHIHCMAFRKVSERHRDLGDASTSLQGGEATAVQEMLYIPQDFNDACYDDVEGREEKIMVNDDDEDNQDFMLATSTELPMFDYNDV